MPLKTLNKGFTLIELLITVAIIGIISLMSYVYLMPYMYRVRLDQNIVMLEQMVQEAQNYAKTKSTNVQLVLNGGEMQIQLMDGTVLSATAYDDEIMMDSKNSASNQYIFNFKGEPVLAASGDPTAFTESDGQVSLCYAPNNACEYTKTITIAPITGIVKPQ